MSNKNNKILDLTLEFLSNGEIKTNDEFISEGAIYDNTRLHRNKKEIKMTLHMDGMESAGIGYILDPYIKIYDGTYSNHTGTARLSMKDCRVIHHNKGGESELVLNKTILDQLDKALKSLSTSFNYKDLTVYDAFYQEIANRYGADKVIKYPFTDVTKTYDFNDDHTIKYNLYFGTQENISNKRKY